MNKINLILVSSSGGCGDFFPEAQECILSEIVLEKDLIIYVYTYIIN